MTPSTDVAASARMVSSAEFLRFPDGCIQSIAAQRRGHELQQRGISGLIDRLATTSATVLRAPRAHGPRGLAGLVARAGSITSSTALRVSGCTSGDPCSTRDTVVCDTPATLAISRLVGFSWSVSQDSVEAREEPGRRYGADWRVDVRPGRAEAGHLICQPPAPPPLPAGAPRGTAAVSSSEKARTKKSSPPKLPDFSATCKGGTAASVPLAWHHGTPRSRSEARSAVASAPWPARRRRMFHRRPRLLGPRPPAPGRGRHAPR